MATKNAVKHYPALCDMPQCMCVDCEVKVFLKGDQLTTDGLPYFEGIVTSIEELSTGGIDVTIQYDDATLPLVEGDPLEVEFSSTSAAGNVCDPDCAGECDWLTKVIRLIQSALPGGLINRHYQLYASGVEVENGVFPVPRIPFVPGYRLTDVRLTCYLYDINTTGTFRLKRGATVIAEFIGSLAQQRQMTILVDDLLNDELPELHITGLTNGVYGVEAEGLVLELIGIQMPTP